MLLTIVGALSTATIVVVAAQFARERRALAADVRALRAELQQLASTTGKERRAPHANPTRADGFVAAGDLDAQAARADEPPDQPARGPRTLH